MTYARAQATALRLITDKGSPIAFARSTRAGYDPVTGANGVTIESAASVAVAKKPTGADVERIRGLELTSAKFAILLVAGTPLGSFQPQPEDSVSFGGEAWVVRDVATLAPDGSSAILYDVVVG